LPSTSKELLGGQDAVAELAETFGVVAHGPIVVLASSPPSASVARRSSCSAPHGIDVANVTTDRCVPAPTREEALRRVNPSRKVPQGPRRKEGAMSAQGATLGRGIVRLPMWPVAALVAAAAAATIGLTMIDGATTSQLPADIPVVVGISHVAPRFQPAVGVSGFENPGAYTGETARTATGLENLGAYTGTYKGLENSLENSGASTSEAEITPTVTWHRPVI
jgi:hypothetical protein